MYVQKKQGGHEMFKSNEAKPGPVKSKWGLEPKQAAQGGKKPPQSPGAGYSGAKGPSKASASYPTKPTKGGK